MTKIPVRNRIRSVIGGFFRRPMIRNKDRFLRNAQASCHEVQLETLKRLLFLNRDSVFSADHGLRQPMNVNDFRRQLPVSDYEYFRPYIDRMRHGEHDALLGQENKLLMFAVSSGTTAAAKLIPITNQFVKDYRRGWQHWGIAAHQEHTTMRYLKMVQIIGKHDQWKTEDGTPCGSISGLVTSMQQRIVRKLYSIPNGVCEIESAADKRHAVARFAFADPLVGMLVTANPATLLQLVNDVCPQTIIRDVHDGTLSIGASDSHVGAALNPYLKANRQRSRELEAAIDDNGRLNPQKCWTKLACLGVWSGGSAGTYVPQLKQSFGNISLRDHGLHASEGRMTIPFEDNTPSGLLDIESHFFEFIPVREAESLNPNVFMAHELHEGDDYYILMTTSSGLYRYNIHDVVRCTGFLGTTPWLEFRHKGAHMSSITGEKISETQVVESVAEACIQTGLRATEFTLTPASGSPHHYQLFIGVDEEHEATVGPEQFAALCDVALRRQNCEYEDKRRTERLGAIVCEVLPQAVWQQFRKSRLQSTGGTSEQYKHPCLLPDPKFENRFISAAGITARNNE